MWLPLVPGTPYGPHLCAKPPEQASRRFTHQVFFKSRECLVYDMLQTLLQVFQFP